MKAFILDETKTDEERIAVYDCLDRNDQKLLTIAYFTDFLQTCQKAGLFFAEYAEKSASPHRLADLLTGYKIFVELKLTTARCFIKLKKEQRSIWRGMDYASYKGNGCKNCIRYCG